MHILGNNCKFSKIINIINLLGISPKGNNVYFTKSNQINNLPRNYTILNTKYRFVSGKNSEYKQYGSSNSQ